ncbi:ABC transporter substrate-binding protein [Candidatus Methylobacter oryzae]|uniref:ABC transporter substrate-binding protein n=1 Tax=Candidatus Methylobacter oryzae TaxID=2497749 RepID=UPI001F4F86F9|nr:ABC transporter substrate-binding protein [Candidatus Methylobacter oryzae]
MPGSLKNNFLTLSRRQFISFLSSLALAQALPECEWLKDRPISIAAHTWPGYEPLFLARDKNWLNSEQVRLLETTSATESLQALTEGKADGAALTLDEVLKARATGLPVSVAMIFDISAGADMLIARSGIKTLADLKGRRIGFERGAVGELILTEVLHTAALTREDVKLLTVNIDEHRGVWDRNEVDAIATYEPVASQLLNKDGVKLFDSRQMANTIVDVLAIHNNVLDYSHRNAISHLISVHFKTLDYLNRNPQDAAYRMSKHLGLPAADVLSALKGLILPDTENNYHWLDGPSPELLVCARKLSNIMVKSELIKQDASLTSLIRADFLPTEFLIN